MVLALNLFFLIAGLASASQHPKQITFIPPPLSLTPPSPGTVAPSTFQTPGVSSSFVVHLASLDRVIHHQLTSLSYAVCIQLLLIWDYCSDIYHFPAGGLLQRSNKWNDSTKR